jgi:hypothetical protein
MRTVKLQQEPPQATLLRGMHRQWVQCKECNVIQYYDYLPYSLQSPIMVPLCGHDFEEDMENINLVIDPRDAMEEIKQTMVRLTLGDVSDERMAQITEEEQQQVTIKLTAQAMSWAYDNITPQITELEELLELNEKVAKRGVHPWMDDKIIAHVTQAIERTEELKLELDKLKLFQMLFEEMKEEGKLQ